MAIISDQVVNYVKVGPATKAIKASGSLVYRWSTGKIEVEEDFISITNLALSSLDDPVKTEIDFNNVLDKYGASTPEELVDYWLENDFFLTDGGSAGGGTYDGIVEPEALKMQESGNYTYFAYAAPGSLYGSPVWKCFRLDESIPGLLLRTWADEGNYTQVATDLTLLTYS